MSGRAMNKYHILTGLLLLAGCNNPSSQPPLSSAPLAGANIGGPFTLIDQDGHPRSDREFAGKFRMVYFGYTSCPDICTPDTQNLMAGLKLFEKAHPDLANKIQPFFITVDPERDTPKVLKQFVRAFHPRLIGLTGTPEQIATAAKEFAVYYARVPGSSPDNYVMSHSQNPYLMDTNGKPLALFPTDNAASGAHEGAPEKVAAELEKWVR